MNQRIFIALSLLSVGEAYFPAQSCRTCDDIQKCEVVLSVGAHLLNAEGSVLDCYGHEIECKRNPDGTLFWTPFDPCKDGLRTEAPAVNATTTNIPPFSQAISSDILVPKNSSELTSDISSSSNSSSTHPLNETTSSKRDPKREPGWLITKSHLKIILWTLFPVAVILLFIGLIVLIVLLVCQRRHKGELQVRPYQSNHTEGYQSARAYGIIANEAPPNAGLGYEKMRNKTHYWVQRKASVGNGAPGSMSATNSSGATPYSSIKRYRSVVQTSRERLDHTEAFPHERRPNSEFMMHYPPSHNVFQLITFGPNDGPQEDIYKNASTTGLSNCAEDVPYPPSPEMNGMKIYMNRRPSEGTEGDPQLSYSQDNSFQNLQSHTTDFDGKNIYFSSYQNLGSFAREPIQQTRGVA